MFVNDPVNHQTIDYERNASLRSYGGRSPDGEVAFVLHWNGQDHYFFASYKFTSDLSHKPSKVVWTVLPYGVVDPPDDKDPASLSQRALLRELIRDALSIYGFMYGEGGTITERVVFSG